MGGAIGNGVDRWRLHYVVDFIHLQSGWFDFPVFNVADMGISVGAGLLLLATLLAPAGGRHRERDAVSDAPSRTDDDR
jgi:signal peptidase II